MKQIIIRVSDELHQEFKLYCVRKKIAMNGEIERLMTRELELQAKREQKGGDDETRQTI